MAKKILVIDPSQIRAGDPDPEFVHKQRLLLFEEVGPNKFKPAPRNDFELLSISIRKDDDALKRARNANSLEDTIPAGKALIERIGRGQNEAVEVRLGNVYDPDKTNKVLSRFKDDIVSSMGIGGIIRNTFFSIRSLGFRRPLMFLPDEDGKLSKVEISQMRGEANIRWTDRGENEIAMAKPILDSGSRLVVNDRSELGGVELDPNVCDDVFGKDTPFAVFPLDLGTEQKGIVAFASERGFEDDTVDIMASYVGFISQNIRRVLGSKTSAIKGLENKQAYAVYADKLIAQSIMDGKPVTIMMADVDGLKVFNDRFAHEAGSLCLDAIGMRVRSFLRRENFEHSKNNPRFKAFSWAGTDEIVIVGMASKQYAVDVAKRMTADIESRRTAPDSELTAEEIRLDEECDKIDSLREIVVDREHRRKTWFRTVSVGVSTFPDDLHFIQPEATDEPISREQVTDVRKQLRLRADEALMGLKRTTQRNKVVTFGGLNIV